MLNFHLAQHILRVTENPKMASGYIRAAFDTFEAGGARGVCEMLFDRFPNICSRPSGDGPWPQFETLLSDEFEGNQVL